MIGSICFLLALLTCTTTCKDKYFFEDAGPLANTPSGTLVGTYVKTFDTTVAAFLGVPFALPPLGRLRFQPPEPMPVWQGLLSAKKKAPSCMQFSYRNSTPAWSSTDDPSEDCLHLNVWSPNKCCCDGDETKLPVLVWIYGGGFGAGSSNLDLYDAATIAAYGEAVVVSFNYRVGAFGFFRLGEAPGNVGMLDQILALKWVKENIHSFGGDPNSITVFGESAGAISISLHLISPLSKGLFHRAILQSGSSYGVPLVDDPQVACFKSKSFAKMAGCANESSDFESPSVLKCMQGVHPLDLAKLEAIHTSKFPTFFSPSHTDQFLPKSPVQAFNDGDASQVDIMVGLNKNEASTFLNYIIPDLFPYDRTPKLNPDLARTVVWGLFQGVPDTVLEAVWSAYFTGVTESGPLLQAVSSSFADFVFNCPVLFLAEKMDRVFFYWMTHRSLKNPTSEWVGVSHFDDVQFVFGRPITDTVLYTPEDGRFSGDVLEKWVNFARTGHPLSRDQDNWPNFNASTPLVYNLNPRTKDSLLFPRRDACQFWRGIVGAST